MSSYRLESPRPRSQLTPIRVRSSYTPSTAGSHTTLLYDLPQSSSTRSPPPSKSTTDPVTYSPPLKSPTLPPDSPRHRPRQTPPPRARSVTPAPTYRQELDKFAAYCRSWYELCVCACMRDLLTQKTGILIRMNAPESK